MEGNCQFHRGWHSLKRFILLWRVSCCYTAECIWRRRRRRRGRINKEEGTETSSPIPSKGETFTILAHICIYIEYRGLYIYNTSLIEFAIARLSFLPPSPLKTPHITSLLIISTMHCLHGGGAKQSRKEKKWFRNRRKNLGKLLTRFSSSLPLRPVFR